MVVAEPISCTLVTGAASSGKSRWAETLASRTGLQVCYLATGPLLPLDADWTARLERHRRRRPSTWQTHEVGAELSAAVRACTSGQVALVDSLGTWVAASLETDEESWELAVHGLVSAIQERTVPLILVGEECGWGVSPPTRIGGLFRQRLGELLQLMTPLCDASWLVVHGRAIELDRLGLLIPEVRD